MILLIILPDVTTASVSTVNLPMLTTPWLTIFIPVVLTLILTALLLVCLMHCKRKKKLSRHSQQEDDYTITEIYSAHKDEDNSDYAIPIDAIKTLDTAQSQRLLGLHSAASKASIASIKTGTLGTPYQKLLAHSGPSNSSVVQGEMCMDLYDTPANALKDEGLELTHRGVQRGVYMVENSPENEGVQGVHAVKVSPEDMGEQKSGIAEEPHYDELPVLMAVSPKGYDK